MGGEGRVRRRFVFCAAILALIAAGRAGIAAKPPANPAGPLSGAAGLQAFFRALASLERHDGRGPVRIVQIGDSHTANDAFSGRLRELLQARFGDAGRGWLPAGVPYKYYRPAQVAVAEEGWRHVKPGDGAAADAAPFGLDASIAEPTAAGARMTLRSGEDRGFERVAVEFVARPGGAPLMLRIDDRPARTIATAAPRVALRRFAAVLPHPAQTVALTAPQASGQQVLGWDIERRGAGIVYENHGTIGATAALLAKLDPAAVSFELKDRRPALLVIAFGTNEAFKDDLDLPRYAALFQGAVAALRRRAGRAAVLVLGPPDGNRLPPGCSAAPAPCGSHAACAWAEPRNLAAVRDIQRRVARRQGWAFWDWEAAMGGRCSIDDWRGRDPPLAMPDHVHPNKEGYAAAADLLFAELMRAYDRWGARR